MRIPHSRVSLVEGEESPQQEEVEYLPSDNQFYNDSQWSFSAKPSEVGLEGKHGHLFTVFLEPNSKRRARNGERQDWFETNLGKLLGPNSHMVCFHRFKVWWMRPVFVQGRDDDGQDERLSQIPPETIMMLFRDDPTDQYRLVLPMERTSLQPSSRGTVSVVSEMPVVSIYSGISPDPYALLREGVSLIARAPSQLPRHRVDWGLGWCTWNAFYTQVSGTKLVDAAQRLQANQIPVRWMILDDGWQHTTNDLANNGKQWTQRLESLRESPTKFHQLSLKDTVTTLHQMGVDHVWVWHTLAGYWMGLNPASPSLPISTLQHTHFPSGIMDNDQSVVEEPSVQDGVGIPVNATEFYEDYHSYLQECGVDGVKVDAQGVVGVLRSQPPGPDQDNFDLLPAVDGLQNALASSVDQRFSSSQDTSNKKTPSLIQCMAHDPQIMYRIPQRYSDGLPLLRASDDHYPDNDYSHGPHIVACAFNSLLLGRLAVPDWDMFRTDLSEETSVRLHAVSRSMSGGPVYLSDTPNDIRRDVVEWISCPDGTILTCSDSALPVYSSLLEDPLALDARPLVLFNTNGRTSVTSGILGVFHLAGSGTWDYDVLDYVKTERRPNYRPTSTVKLSPSLIPQFKSPEMSFLAFPFFERQTAWILDMFVSTLSIDLARLACDAITMVPLTKLSKGIEVAPLGYTTMINGAGAVLETQVMDAASVQLTVHGCGTFMVAYRALEGAVQPTFTLNGQSVEHQPIVESTKQARIPMGVLNLGYQLAAVRVLPSAQEQSMQLTFNQASNL